MNEFEEVDDIISENEYPASISDETKTVVCDRSTYKARDGTLLPKIWDNLRVKPAKHNNKKVKARLMPYSSTFTTK